MTKCSHCHYHGHSMHTCPIKKKKLIGLEKYGFLIELKVLHLMKMDPKQFGYQNPNKYLL